MSDQKSDSSQSVELPLGMMTALQNGDETVTDVNMGAGGMMDLDLNPIDINMPQLRILEQPKSRGFRFRYGCEGPSHGGLPGEHSQKGKKSYPSVEIINYKGDARIVVSLVTDEEVPKPHAHSLVGKHCCNGICTVQVGPKDLTACFQNLGIQHVTRKEVVPVLKRRILEHQKVFNALIGPNTATQIAEEDAESRAKSMAKDMDLSKVKLCFQAYLKDVDGRFTRALTPVLSNVVYDSKAPNATTLKICRMDKSSGSAKGGDEIYLLCDKVQKDDIEVRFFEVNSKGELTWERSADFGPTDVHRQYAIVFKTPIYRDGNIDKPVCVQVQLRRKSDSEVSDPKPFTYHPPIQDREGILRKRAKRLPVFDQGGGPGNEGGGGGGGGAFNFPFALNPSAFGNLQHGGMQTQNNGMQQNNGMGMQHPSGPSQMQHNPQPVVTHPEMVNGHHMQQPQQLLMQQMGQQQLPQQQMSQHQMNHQQNGFNSIATNGIHPDLQSRGTSRVSKMETVQVKTEQKDFDELSENLSSVELEAPGSENKFELSEHFPLSIQADSCKVQSDDMGFGLDFPTEIESDACALPKAVENFDDENMYRSKEITSGYISDDEDDFETRKDRLLGGNGKKNKRRGSGMNVEKDSRTESRVDQSVQTVEPEIDYEAKVWELADLYSRCLQEFAKSGDMRMILQSQRHLCSLDDENGDTPLHLAVIHNQPEALFSLLSVVITIQDQNIVNQKNRLDQTPLHLAVVTQQIDMVHLLLRCGADPNVLDQNGFNALHHAVDAKFHAAITALLEGPPGKPALPLIPVDADALNLDGYSAMHMAVERKDISAVRALVKGGADKDIPDGKSGRAPLHKAVLMEDFSMLSYLIADARVNIHVEDFVGNTPLHIASAYDLSAVAALLIAAGANPEFRNNDAGSGESDVDEGYEFSEEEDEERTGSSALDFAQSEKMRKILRGEKYAPTIHSVNASEIRNKISNMSYVSESDLSAMSTTNSSAFISERLRLETQPADMFESKQVGDMSKLPPKYMNSLVKRLDITHPLAKDWRAVADQLGMGNMINHLRMFASPTQVLLDQYALMDGTLAELLKVMEDLGRKDAINILNEAFSHMKMNSDEGQLDNEVSQIKV